MSEIAIKVENVSKAYTIWKDPSARLKHPFLDLAGELFPALRPRIDQKMQGLCTEFYALRDVSFEVKKGESVGIIGRNGSGKSTLLQIIAGTLQPTEGSVTVNGRVAALLELGSGFNPEFTGRENVYLNCSILGLTKEETDARFNSIADFADIGDFLEQPVKTYSSGMVVRLGFATAINVNPEILIVDEALSVGDERFQRKCFSRIEEIKQSGATILFVSHSGGQIIELCDSAILLESGEFLKKSEPRRTVKSYQKIIYAPQLERKEIIRILKKGLCFVEDNNSNCSKKSNDEIFLDERNSAFDPNLIPESTIVYAEQGARIHTIEVHDEYARSVNILGLVRKYKLVMIGEALSDIENVYFGTHIKSTSGLEITGQRYPEHGKTIERINKGDKFSISFEYRMGLLPGCYFLGGGVWSASGAICSHRIIDATMIRVLNQDSSHSFGYCDMMLSHPELNIG